MAGRPKGSKNPHGLHYLTSGIAKARLRAGMTTAEAAALMGLGQLGGQFGKIERGETSLTAHDALTLCKAWDVSLEDLLEGVPCKRHSLRKPGGVVG